MAGDNMAVPKGTFVELMATVEWQGSITSEEIAEILNIEDLSIEAELPWSVGGD